MLAALDDKDAVIGGPRRRKRTILVSARVMHARQLDEWLVADRTCSQGTASLSMLLFASGVVKTETWGCRDDQRKQAFTAAIDAASPNAADGVPTAHHFLPTVGTSAAMVACACSLNVMHAARLRRKLSAIRDERRDRALAEGWDVPWGSGAESEFDDEEEEEDEDEEGGEGSKGEGEARDEEEEGSGGERNEAVELRRIEDPKEGPVDFQEAGEAEEVASEESSTASVTKGTKPGGRKGAAQKRKRRRVVTRSQKAEADQEKQKAPRAEAKAAEARRRRGPATRTRSKR